jgi:hypothetical protein
MIQLSATRCSCIAILQVSLVSFASITLFVSSQRALIFVHFVIDSARKLLDIPSYIIRVIKSRGMRWAGHVAHMEEMRNVCSILVGNSEGKRPLENLGVDRRLILEWIIRK